jgi:hypothetical protein
MGTPSIRWVGQGYIRLVAEGYGMLTSAYRQQWMGNTGPCSLFGG